MGKNNGEKMELLQELETLEAYEQEQSNVKYYMEEPRSSIATNANGQTKIIYDITVDVDGPIIEVQQVHHPIITAMS